MNQTTTLAEQYEDAYWTERFALQAEQDARAQEAAHQRRQARIATDRDERNARTALIMAQFRMSPLEAEVYEAVQNPNSTER